MRSGTPIWGAAIATPSSTEIINLEPDDLTFDTSLLGDKRLLTVHYVYDSSTLGDDKEDYVEIEFVIDQYAAVS